MAFIVDLFSTRTDLAIQIGNEEILRPLSIGTNWQKIRIGVRMGFTGAASNITGSFITFGVCTGNSGWKSPGTVEWVGAALGSTVDNSLYTYVIATPPYYTNGGVSMPGLTKINGVATVRTGSSTTSYISANVLTARTAMYVDIQKGTPYTVITYNPNSVANAQTDITTSVFTQGMETDGTPTGITGPATGTWTHPGAGLMDTVSVAWNRSVPALNIFDIAVARIL
jgi:hypothetical protein